MRLLKLEVHGFKSFADRTIFDFESGLTAFVGPNGCGKSNIVDAVKWVLGEQSARSLRGSEMIDVIFNGSEGRKSLGFAEVSLTVSNEDHMLLVDYEDVCVTRRLYRSGESEYLINKQPARLRDIRELFMDTGIGMDAYSMIEQGKVEVLISANPQSRRSIFEEAAGISKFKAQKKQAIAKLERVQQNLARLGDIIEEVERQLRSIKRQASKARSYKRVADQLRELRVELALHRYHEFTGRLDEVLGKIASAQDERQMMITRIEAIDAERSELDASALELDKALTRVQNADVQLQGRFSAAQDAINYNHERIQELNLTETKLANEVESIKKRLASLKGDLLSSIDEIAGIEREVAERKERLLAIRSELHLLSQKCADFTRQVEEQRTIVLELMRMMSRKQNALTQFGAERRGLEARGARLRERQEVIAGEVREAGLQREAVCADLERFKAERVAAQLEIDECTQRRDVLNRHVHDLSDRLAEQRDELTSLQSRKELLEDLEERREGLGAGSRHVMDAARRDGGELHGIRGLVADLVETDLAHAVAVEAALGDAAQSIVTESFQQAVAAVELLRDSGQGRASFFSLDRVRPEMRQTPSPTAYPGLLGRARDLVRSDDATAPVFDHLLGDVLVVQSFEHAVTFSSNGLGSWRIVTLDGEIFEPGGAITGGKTASRAGLITRKAELREIGARVIELQSSVGQLEAELAENSHLRDSVELRIEELRDQASELAIIISQKMHQVERLDDNISRLTDEQQVGRNELDEIDEQLKRIAVGEEELRGEVDRIRRQEADAEAKAGRMEAERQSAERQRARLEESVTELKVGIAQQSERRESLEAATVRMMRSIDDYKLEAVSALDEIEQSRQRRADAEAAIAEKEDELADISRRREELQVRQVELTAEREGVRVAVDANTTRMREARSAIQQTDKMLQEHRLSENNLRIRLEDLAERTRDADEADLGELYVDYSPPEDIDWDARAREVEALQLRIKRMGNVNLNAIDEQDELEQRASFLSSQRDDLEKSRHQLMEVIRKINHQSRKMFQETFDAIRENFQQTFRKLFGGGRADLVLEDDKDILEAGVDIIARPPGKEPCSISLLSGGEKSLTAVELLFAIFRSKPSPFCILDEVDAALDEDNTERFVSMLREYLKDSQFIIVTHSRRTMGMADVMYGITMQESGVSKKVSVRLGDAETKVA